ncbi:hypothetical protein DPMN_102002 [Dreissena polymorpha]|uniref:Uncharacterized protein n=1 Tax=Dreissena polymorpha TaxID=45954 RepID=A0A9D4LKB9_DREPO|nr:hypothetical protein DPMN_102002 [Dreissena polymorpha]
MQVARDATVFSQGTRGQPAGQSTDSPTHLEAALCERRPIFRNRCASSLVNSTGRRPATIERPAERTRQGSPHQRHGSHVRLSVSGPTSSSPVRTAKGRPVASSRLPSVYAAGTTSAAELLAFAKLFIRLVAPSEGALARLPLYKRAMSLLSNIGPERSATARETRHVAIYIGMISSPSVPSKTGFYPLICRSRPPIYYRPKACLRKPPLRRGPSAAYAGSPAVFGRESAVPGRDKRSHIYSRRSSALRENLLSVQVS